MDLFKLSFMDRIQGFSTWSSPSVNLTSSGHSPAKHLNVSSPVGFTQAPGAGRAVNGRVSLMHQEGRMQSCLVAAKGWNSQISSGFTYISKASWDQGST